MSGGVNRLLRFQHPTEDTEKIVSEPPFFRAASADHQTQQPDAGDDQPQQPVGEDGEVGERTNDDGAADDGHGGEVPDGARAETVHPAIDQPHQLRRRLFTDRGLSAQFNNRCRSVRLLYVCVCVCFVASLRKKAFLNLSSRKHHEQVLVRSHALEPRIVLEPKCPSADNLTKHVGACSPGPSDHARPAQQLAVTPLPMISEFEHGAAGREEHHRSDRVLC